MNPEALINIVKNLLNSTAMHYKIQIILSTGCRLPITPNSRIA